MRSLRDPISAGEAVRLLLGVAGLVAVQYAAGGRLSLAQLLWLSLSLGFLVGPLSVLVHELGHALAVARLGKRRAQVVVGHGPWVELRAGRVHVRFSPLPNRGVMFGGLCVYDPTGLSWRTLGLISLAGPCATLVELAAVCAAAPHLWHLGLLARSLLIFGGAGLLVSLVQNLRPEPFQASPSRAIVAQRDGWKARRAFALQRQGAALPNLRPTSGSNRSTAAGGR